MGEKSFCSDLFTGTERAFKGIGILFSIYAIGMYFAIVIVSNLTEAHVKLSEKDPNYDHAKIEHILHKREVLDHTLLIFGIVFTVVAFVSFLLRFKYRNVKGISASEIEAKKDFLRISYREGT